MKSEIYTMYVDATECATFGFDAYEQMDYVEDFLNRWFFGEPLPQNWRLPRYEVGAPHLPMNDFVYGGAGNFCFVSFNAKKAIESIIGWRAEFRSIGTVLGGINLAAEYFVMNVLNVINCLDEEKSKIIYSRSDGRVLSLQQAIFDTEKVKTEAVIFKVPQDTSVIFATNTFVDCIRKYRLTGVGFEHPNQIGISSARNAFFDLPIQQK